MACFVSFLPILLFIVLFAGSGVYFTLQGVDNAFYQLSPLTAIIPAIALAWILYKGSLEERMHTFLDGVRHRDIITMCIIFLLAGAFSEVTKAIGSVDATVNFTLSLVSPRFLLIGLFMIAVFISTAIGTSMGTIATIAPIAAGLSAEGAFSPALAAATVISGAMFGDNLSVISDTTIAAVMSQQANTTAKLKLNAKVATITALITVVILYFSSDASAVIETQEYSFLLVIPYIFLIILAVCGVNVFIALVTSLVLAWIIGYIDNGYGVIAFSHDITHGFASMQEIMLLSLMIGGLAGLVSKDSLQLAEYFTKIIDKNNNKVRAQLVIAKMVAIFDLLLANNTIAIIFCGKIAKDIANRYKIPAHYTATWLDSFACVFQGIIPYGAQVLLASTIVKVSPLSVTPHVYYCYILAIVAVCYILYKRDNLE